MIIHKPESERKPHEGLEYHHKSKEPETIQECALLFCCECVCYGVNGMINIDKCQTRIALRKSTLSENGGEAMKDIKKLRRLRGLRR